MLLLHVGDAAAGPDAHQRVLSGIGALLGGLQLNLHLTVLLQVHVGLLLLKLGKI